MNRIKEKERVWNSLKAPNPYSFIENTIIAG
jgi:hypothetical protein